MAKLTEEQKKKLRQQFDSTRNNGLLENNRVENTNTYHTNNNPTLTQRVQATYENNMRQAEMIRKQQSNTKQNTQVNVPRTMTNGQINANTGTGMRSTAKTSNVNVGKLPVLNETQKNKGVLPNKYEGNKEASKEKNKGLLKDVKNITSNFGLGIKKAGESSMYYIEEMSNKQNNYKRHNQFMSKLNQNKEQEENLKNGKTLEGKEIIQRSLPNLKDFKQQQLVKQATDPILQKAKEVQNLESPVAQNLSQKMIADEEKIQQNIDSSSNPISRKIAELMPSIAQSTTGLAASAINPGLGFAFWQTSAGGDYIKDAKLRGMNDEDALKYGTIMGAMESATEWVGGELTKGVGKAISKGEIVKGLKALGLDMGENFFEESIMEPIQEAIASMTGGKETADWSNMAQRMLQSGIDGALTSIIMGGASAGIGKATSLIGKMQSGEKITQEEIADTLKEINKQEEIDIEKVLVSSFGFNSQDLYKNIDAEKRTNKRLDNVANEVVQYEARKIIEDSTLTTEQKEKLEEVAKNNNLTSEQVNYLIENTLNGKYDTGNESLKQNYSEINEFNGYTQKEIENLKSNKIQIAENKQSISNFAKQAKSIPGNIKLYVGKIKQNVADSIKSKLGIDTNNYNISLSADNIRHAINQHSNIKKETARGQEPLTIEDFENIPDIINNPDNLEEAGKSKQGKPAIRFEKNINGNNVVITYTSDKHKTLEFQTMYKFKNDKKNSLVTASNEKTLDTTSKTNSDTADNSSSNYRLQLPSETTTVVDTVDNVSTLNTSIPQNENKMQVPTEKNNKYRDIAKANKLIKEKNEKIRALETDLKQVNSEEAKQFLQNQINTIENNYNSEIQKLYDDVNENTLVSNQEISYNNNESEVDNNGFRRERMGESVQTARIAEIQENQYTEEGFRQTEERAKTNQSTEVSAEQREIKQNYEKEIGKEIRFFEGTQNDMPAFASKQEDGVIYINRTTFENYTPNKIIYHEVLESEITHNDKVREVAKETARAITGDNNFNNQINEFFKDSEITTDNPYAIAKDIICDMYAKYVTGEELDYNNVLDIETNAIVNNSLERIDNLINRNENSKESSFSLPKLEKKLPLDQTNPFTSDSITDMYREKINQGKNRKHYKTVFESKTVGEAGRKASKELFAKDTYVPISNQKTITEVNDSIRKIGEENSYTAFRVKIAKNEKVTLQDIATGERLIQIYSQQGDYKKVQDLIQDVAILGTELGQQVQALSLIKKMSPEGQLQMLTKVVERTNQKKSNSDLKVTEDMAKRILESKNQEELENTMTEVAKELGEQLPVTLRDEIRSWRYFSMLGNPRTHIRNIGANVVMNITKTGKDLVAGGIEDVVSVWNKDMERTKTLKRSTKEQIQFAKQDAEIMKDLIDGGGKYDIQNRIEENSRSSNSKVLNAVEQFNSNALDIEDKIFLKLAYQQSLQNYMTANKLNPKDMTGKKLEEARQYARQQAQEATFHQFSALANTLTQIEKKGGIGGKFIEAVLPFKKTPINIAKSGIEYSPIGLAKSLTYDLNSLRKQTNEYKNMLEQGKVSQEEYRLATSKLLTKQIDDMAKGLTGTAIATIGYFLAQSGILKAGNDGDDDEFEEGQGKQEYSIRIGDTTYSLDWVSPSAIPLFIGATIQDLISGDEEFNDDYLNAIATSFAKSVEPMTEMSMLQNLTSAISSYEQGSSNMIFDLGASAAFSYLGQFLPTAVSQTAKVMDPNVRDTSSTKKRYG